MSSNPGGESFEIGSEDGTLTASQDAQRCRKSHPSNLKGFTRRSLGAINSYDSASAASGATAVGGTCASITTARRTAAASIAGAVFFYFLNRCSQPT